MHFFLSLIYQCAAKPKALRLLELYEWDVKWSICFWQWKPNLYFCVNMTNEGCWPWRRDGREKWTLSTSLEYRDIMDKNLKILNPQEYGARQEHHVFAVFVFYQTAGARSGAYMCE